MSRTIERHGRKMLLHFLHSRHPWRSDSATEPYREVFTGVS